MGRADEAGLLGAPPGEADLVAHARLRQLQGGLEDRGTARAVVLDAGTCVHRVEVAADHDDVRRVAPARLGQHVVRGGDASEGVGFEAQHEAGRRGELLADGLRDRGDRDVQGEAVAERAADGARGVVVDDDPARAGVVRVRRLDREGARTALDERDVAGGEAGEVGGLAPGGST